jgi:hypothetical protein
MIEYDHPDPERRKRTAEPDPDPSVSKSMEWLNHARSLSRSLERGNTGSGYPHPDFQV